MLTNELTYTQITNQAIYGEIDSECPYEFTFHSDPRALSVGVVGNEIEIF
jgi:hypothetical protein